jgi:SnoaL-like protein
MASTRLVSIPKANIRLELHRLRIGHEKTNPGGRRGAGLSERTMTEVFKRPAAFGSDREAGRDQLRMRAVLDRDEIRDVIAQWALCRDTGRWETLRSLFAPGATMQTTWFEGSADEFVDRSMAAYGKGTKAQHAIGTSVIALRGERATAETRVVLLLRAPLGAMQVDVTCHGRFYDFFEKLQAQWRIRRRIPVYEKDRVDPVDPSTTLELDRETLSRFAEGYRHLAYVQALGGATLTKGLISPGSADERNLYAEGAAWLNGGTGEAK